MVHLANVKVDIEWCHDESGPYYNCRLFHCGEMQHEWTTRWRWVANYGAKMNIRRYKNGIRWEVKPPKGAKKWTVR